ncbi:MAG: hypothetical protein L6R38_008321, partial [Xanthoria sp. 2 TBL-2021]
MTREEIISTSGVLLIGGSETTATLLSGATYHLLTNPDILAKLQAEVRGAFQDESDMTLNSLAKHDLLPYLEAVLTESLRMYPPVPANLPRMTGPEGDVIDGYFVPANVRVCLGIITEDSPRTKSHGNRPPSVFTNGRRTKPARTLQIPHPSSPSDGYQTHQGVTVTTAKQRYSRFHQDRATVSGK